MKIDYKNIYDIQEKYGDSFYLLDLEVFSDNYKKLLSSFRKYWEKTDIAYSFKTNYTPVLCSQIAKMGGCAEVVSDMELYLAKKIGFGGTQIFFNGPYKQPDIIEDFLLSGGHLNIDSLTELEHVIKIAQDHKDKDFDIGIRFALDIGQEMPSRFGFDLESFNKACDIVNRTENVTISGIHTHLPYRSLDTFKKRAVSLTEFLSVLSDINLDYISIGGGFMGPMPNGLASDIVGVKTDGSISMPSFADYADAIAAPLSEVFAAMKWNDIKLILEPGSALVANAMSLFCKIVSIKNTYNKSFITVVGSTFNMNPTVRGVNRPITVYNSGADDSTCSDSFYVEDGDIVGFTCIEGDCLYKGFTGKVKVGDFVEFNNVGSYSVTMNPAFIRPAPPIIMLDEDGRQAVVRATATFDKVFETFI